MDTAAGITQGPDRGRDDARGGVTQTELSVGGDERRMHVRAYNHWVSLLRGRAYPSIEDIDPASIADFGPHSVLLDFTQGIEDPRIAFLGTSLRVECGVEIGIKRVAEVPSRSLLSRLTDHYLQIIANRAPIGFEAEFVSQRGHNTMYRGILMPFSSDQDTIDYIYGVINWKEMVDAETQAKLNAELDAARRTAPPPARPTAVWADGPGSLFADDAGATETAQPEHVLPSGYVPEEETTLADRLLLARESAAAARAADTRTRAALYRALGRAWEFTRAIGTDPETYAELLDDAGIKPQARAPLTPVVKLVFGADYDKTRLTEFATVLAHAERQNVPADGLPTLLETTPGGIKAIVAAERAERRPARAPATDYDAIRAALLARAPLAQVAIDAGAAGDFVVLLARKGDAGTLDVVAAIDTDAALAERVARRAA